MFGLRDSGSGVVGAVLRHLFNSKAGFQSIENHVSGLEGEIFEPRRPLPVPIGSLKDITPPEAFG